jgi:glyoxylase-like metal-dependent hydrolase (beta-lactamase superfamily II)
MTEYTRGLHDVGEGLYAFLQPDGGWGWSNAGLIVDGESSLLVDTLFDLRLTGEMLGEMKRRVPQAGTIDTLVNTHANGDHTWGNQLVGGARIVASKDTAEEMMELPPATLEALSDLAPQMGVAGEFMLEIFGKFDFAGIELTPPTETFDGTFELRVGDKDVQLIEVGPAHTRGDTLVLVPRDRVLFSGDILFHGGHPIVWAGPISNWIAACDRILDMDLDVIVPGHGPLADKEAIRELRSYFEYIEAEARKRFEAGMSALEAARDIALDRYASWGDAERVVVNVDAVYRELSESVEPANPIELFEQMAQFANDGRGHA